MNCKAGTQSMFQRLFYNIMMHVLSFGLSFEIFSCYVLGKCSDNCPQVSRPVKESKGPRYSRRASGNHKEWKLNDDATLCKNF